MDALERLDDETCAALLKGITSSDADELEYKSLGNEETPSAVSRTSRGEEGTRRSKNELFEQRRRRDDIEATNHSQMSDGICRYGHESERKRERRGARTYGGGDDAASAKKNGENAKKREKTRDESLQSLTARRLTSEPLFFESGRGSVASDMGIDPWPSSAWGVARASAPPASWYAAEPNARRESETVFRRGWHFCGRADQAPRGAPGSYFTATVGGSAGASIVVVRGTDDKLRAFWNVCRHRAMEVAPDPNASVPPTESNANTGNASFGLFADVSKNVSKTARKRRRAQDVLLAAVLPGRSVLPGKTRQGMATLRSRRSRATAACFATNA